MKKKMDNKQIYLDSLKELNYYFINLNVNIDLASQCIVSLGKRTMIENKTIQTLLS